jgi:hypothetical protein
MNICKIFVRNRNRTSSLSRNLWSVVSVSPFLSFVGSITCHSLYLNALKPSLVLRSTPTGFHHLSSQRRLHPSPFSTTSNSVFFAPSDKQNMESNNNNDDMSSDTLSKQELRRRRLAAFGILQPQNIDVNQISTKNANSNSNNHNFLDVSNADSNDNLSDDNTDFTIIGRKLAPEDRAKQQKLKASQVISILDDSDDDSYIDLMTEFRQIKNRGSKSSTTTQSGKYSANKIDSKVGQSTVANFHDTTEMTLSNVVNTSKVMKRKFASSSRENNDSSDDTNDQSDTAINSSTESRSTWNFKVATWNVWFGREGDGSPHPAPRMRAIVRMLKEHSTKQHPLLFIGFQEVIEPLVEFLFAALDAAGFRVFRQPGSTYGCAVAVDKRLEIISHAWIPYSDTIMQRGFYQVRAKLPNKYQTNECPEIVFTTTHLESFAGPHYNGAVQRVPQLQEMEQYCNQQVSMKSASIAVMTGDMNWDDEKLRGQNLDPKMSSVLQKSDQWKDAWLKLPSTGETTKKSTNAGYTYDAKINPMLGGNLRRRFDRCLLRSRKPDAASTPHDSWKVKSLNAVLLGQDALPGLTWEKYNPYKKTYSESPTAPSDHFGLVVQIQLSKRNDVS